MIDDFEASVRDAGKAGAVQAFAMVETVVNIFLAYNTDVEGASHLKSLGDGFSDGWASCAGALSELATAMRKHAAESAVMSGAGEGELVHMRPEAMHGVIVAVLDKYLFKRTG